MCREADETSHWPPAEDWQYSIKILTFPRATKIQLPGHYGPAGHGLNISVIYKWDFHLQFSLVYFCAPTTQRKRGQECRDRKRRSQLPLGHCPILVVVRGVDESVRFGRYRINCLLFAKSVTLHDKVRSFAFRKALNVEPLLLIERLQLRWFGRHLVLDFENEHLLLIFGTFVNFY